MQNIHLPQQKEQKQWKLSLQYEQNIGRGHEGISKGYSKTVQDFSLTH